MTSNISPAHSEHQTHWIGFPFDNLGLSVPTLFSIPVFLAEGKMTVLDLRGANV
jgi:hypothetical protein